VASGRHLQRYRMRAGPGGIRPIPDEQTRPRPYFTELT
jgi:hypothetical protein